jgi:trehalose 6-phosphate synthase
MDRQERLARMKRLRRVAARQHVFWWVDSFLQAAIARDLASFPEVDDYVPRPPGAPSDEIKPDRARASLTSSRL